MGGSAQQVGMNQLRRVNGIDSIATGIWTIEFFGGIVDALQSIAAIRLDSPALSRSADTIAAWSAAGQTTARTARRTRRLSRCGFRSMGRCWTTLAKPIG